jgi:hypothetical protein
MDRSISAPLRVGQKDTVWVWYDETVALLKGQGVCYNYNYNSPANQVRPAAETAASVDYQRTNRVKLPTILNAPYFAGVANADYAAQPNGQLIEICVPGSTCLILTKANLTLGVGRITCQAGGTLAGYFTNSGFAGQGSAKPLQTNDTSTTAGKTLAILETGPQSGLQETLSTGTAGGATVFMVGGVTHLATATNAASVTNTLANGVADGDRKRVVIDGTQTTSGLVLTVTTGVKFDGSTGITTLVGSTAATEADLEWLAGKWYLRSASLTVS